MSIFLSTFIIRPIVAYNYLKAKNAMSEMLELIYENISHFKSQYDRKLLIMGFCSLWKEQFDNEENSEMTLKVFQIMIYMMIVQEYDEQKKNFKTRIKTDYEQQDINIYQAIKARINPSNIHDE